MDESAYNAQMKALGLDWDYERQEEMEKKSSLRVSKLEEAKRLINELIDEGTLFYFNGRFTKPEEGLKWDFQFDALALYNKPI